MRGVTLTAVLIGVGVTLSESAIAQALEDRAATYACTVQAVVGLQSGKDGKRFSGRITPDPERFMIKVDYDSTDITVSQYRGRYEAWWFQAKYSAKFVGRDFYPLRSDEGRMFIDVFGMSNLWIGGDGKYRIVEGALSGNSYLEEGVCARM